MSPSKTLAGLAPAVEPMSLTENLKQQIQRQPLGVQVALTSGLGLLLLGTLAIFDPIPIVDELVLGWLLFTSISATSGTLQKRREKSEPPRVSASVDVRAQQGTPEAAEEDGALSAAKAEVGALEGKPGAKTAAGVAAAGSPRSAS